MLKNLAFFLFEEMLWITGLMPTTRRRIANDYVSRHGAIIEDMRKPGEMFCQPCPDHEACASGYPCSVVRKMNGVS